MDRGQPGVTSGDGQRLSTTVRGDLNESKLRRSESLLSSGIVTTTPDHNASILTDRHNDIVPSLLETHVKTSDTTLNS